MDQRYVVIPESKIKMAMSMAGDENDTFKSILLKCELFKYADMTPMIIMDNEYRVYVVAEETFGKKLH